jgi:hypothetical protein
MTVDRLSADEVAERAGTTSEHIALLAKVGILEPEDDGTYPRRDVLRARSSSVLVRWASMRTPSRMRSPQGI